MAKNGSNKEVVIQLEFDDNRLLTNLFGEHNQHLSRIEKLLEVQVASRGNVVAITGEPKAAEIAKAVLNALHTRLTRGLDVDLAEVDSAIRLIQSPADEATQAVDDQILSIPTRRKHITPRSPTQANYIKSLRSHHMVFGLGPAGTGKTYLAVAQAVSMLLSGQIERIILSRPAVEAGERLGFLPGDLRDKIDPYLRPLYDALEDMLPMDQIIKRLDNGEIEVAPLAFMRGRTLSNAFVILDEAQNTTHIQMKMFLTRFGENSRMVITGDMTQIDLPTGELSGLQEAVMILKDIKEIDFVHFSYKDVVRNPLVSRIIKSYEAIS